jgi:SAM-dependent methyltransferase
LRREELIESYIRNKEVLDVGSVGQTEDYDLWSFIKERAKKATGIDTEPSTDNSIVRGSIESTTFEKKFDVVVLGDVLEHVDNQGLVLDNVRKHLKDDGVMIVTTPNAKWLTVAFRPNPTHTAWHDKYTIFNILQRHGFRVKHFQFYCGNKRRYSLFKRLLASRQAMIVVCGKV